jgi:hypothetical protein
MPAPVINSAAYTPRARSRRVQRQQRVLDTALDQHERDQQQGASDSATTVAVAPQPCVSALEAEHGANSPNVR